MEEIKVKCKAAFDLDISQLNDFQGNLKTLTKVKYEKFKRNLIKNGIKLAKHVWKNPEDKKWYIIDGHQTKRLLSAMQSEGYKIPLIPVAQVIADSFQEAKETVLLANSSYGEMEDDGLYEFLSESEIDVSFLEDLNFLELKIPDFIDNYYGDPNEIRNNPDVEWAKEIDEKNDYIVLLFNSKEQFKKAAEYFGVKQVKLNNSATKHVAFDSYGVGRILDGGEIYERLSSVLPKLQESEDSDQSQAVQP